uniref:SKP1 component POZ domain-containing protein n=1 Tax=Chromera velia CCMP2878 TaxID=1169474 RepID=A0A0G4HKB4_9ALVE|eukprot:Cvel_7258.t1-p1 / transcript=Cvel_7258.t1 / gene=Cvel_7258 / organism=Chromera_velia_CCMP2878 / gene_product=hypothetical protein / transcript_product=hypothetical protein / location=Cvel_scaffold375:856-1536(-) / protein_length=89 / sequence_SO=supercontig / SO=protein_coding / is_pseudo=false
MGENQKRQRKLSCSTGATFEVDEAVVQVSKYLSEGLIDGSLAEDETIPLPGIQPETLERLILYCRHHSHKDNPVPEVKRIWPVDIKKVS